MTPKCVFLIAWFFTIMMFTIWGSFVPVMRLTFWSRFSRAHGDELCLITSHKQTWRRFIREVAWCCTLGGRETFWLLVTARRFNKSKARQWESRRETWSEVPTKTNTTMILPFFLSLQFIIIIYHFSPFVLGWIVFLLTSHVFCPMLIWYMLTGSSSVSQYQAKINEPAW